MTWELTVIWYIALFAAAIFSLVRNVGFIFFIPISFFGTFLAALITLTDPSTFAEPLLVNGDTTAEETSDETAPLLGDIVDERRDSIEAEEERLNGLLTPKCNDTGRKTEWWDWFWLARFGFMVPLQALIALEMIAWEILPALHQTLTDGSPSILVFMAAGAYSLVALLNTTPFLLRLPFKSTSILLLPALVVMIVTVSSAPMNRFTLNAPFKMFFRSTYDLDTGNSTAYIYGMDPYLKEVLPYVPTINENGLTCEPFLARGGRVCKYTVPPPIAPNHNWFNITSVIEEETSEHFIVKVRIYADTTRVCYLEFDKDIPPEIVGIGGVRFYSKTLPKRDNYTDLRMFKRDWAKEPFNVLLKFKKDAPRNVTVACNYDEWSPNGNVGYVRSLDEIWRSIPAWASVTKFTTGLLQVRRSYPLN